MKNVMITAHTGCEGTPDNSMESILTGIELGAEALNAPYKYINEGIFMFSAAGSCRCAF